LSAEIDIESFTRENRVPIAGPSRIKTIRLPVEARYFASSGLFARLGASYVRQQVTPGESVSYDRTHDNFAILDAAIGYRLSNRRGIVSLEANNVLDERFLYQDLSFLSSEPVNDPRYIPSRTILLRLTLSF